MGIPFECDMCQFRNVNDRYPIHGNARDNYTLLYIRQEILDAFWSRETSTVLGNFRRLIRYYFDSVEAIIIIIPVPIIGTNEIRDIVGMGCEIHTLDAMSRKGKWQDQLQWDSMCRTPTWYNNTWEEGAGSSEAGTIYSANVKNVHESTSPTEIIWFSRFMLGGKRSMGVVRRQDEALTVDQLILIGEIAEKDWLKSNYEEEKKELDSTIALATIDFCMSLRGEEVPLIVIEGMNMFWKENRNQHIPHMMMTPKGRFKGENNLRWHCVPLVDQTKSGIPTRRWIIWILYRRCNFENQEFFFVC